MIVEQIYTGCLAQGAYFIESNGEVAIIDPLRESKPYLDKIEKVKGTLKYIFETHFHADFVSGHVELAEKTGAKIVYGNAANTAFDCILAADNEVFQLGNIQLKVIHTPGHTLESICILLIDENGIEKYLFTGDTLFIGDVGRPDLAQKSNLSINDLAGMLYDSLHNKIFNLPNTVIIYPAHGAGSACGKNMSQEKHDTLGGQKETNYALKTTSKKEFIAAVTDGLTPPPYYFPRNVQINKEGAQNALAISENVKAFTVDEFENTVNLSGSLVLDTRNPQVFKDGFIPKSINIGLNGDFAPWVGTLITDILQPIVFIAEPGKEAEVIQRLTRVGYDSILGYLEGGFNAWQKANKDVDTIESKEPFEIDFEGANILDIRKISEYENGYYKTAIHFPLEQLNNNMNQLDINTSYVIHCAGGYRSMMAASILKARGFEKITDVKGGYNAILNLIN